MDKINESDIVSDTKTVLPWYKKKKNIVILILVLCLVLFNIKYSIVIVSGPSMEPSYTDGNILLGDKQYDYLNRYDTVVIYSQSIKKPLIKRVIGLPGETITYLDNKLYVNGEYIEDRYNYGTTEDFTVTLSNNQYFCLGDNRSVSLDSRTYGSFSKSEIIAKIYGKQYISVLDALKRK